MSLPTPRRGRPPRSPGPAVNMTVRVTMDELARIDDLASEAGLARSDYVRARVSVPEATLVLPAIKRVRDEILALQDRTEALHEALDGVSAALRLVAEEEH